MDEIKAVIFDMDGTITPTANSWLATTLGLGASVDDHKAIYFKGFKEGNVSYDNSRAQLIKLWRETGHATRAYLQEMFESWPVIREAEELISFFRSKGLKIALITSATSMYAAIVAKKFSIDDYYASGELIFDQDGNLVDFHFPHDDSQHKLEDLHDFCHKYSLTPQYVVALGDSDNDVHIFTETKRGILVGQDKPQILREVAWKEANDLTEVKDLLNPLLK